VWQLEQRALLLALIGTTAGRLAALGGGDRSAAPRPAGVVNTAGGAGGAGGITACGRRHRRRDSSSCGSLCERIRQRGRQRRGQPVRCGELVVYDPDAAAGAHRAQCGGFCDEAPQRRLGKRCCCCGGCGVAARQRRGALQAARRGGVG
jgi:hypothetical protein